MIKFIKKMYFKKFYKIKIRIKLKKIKIKKNKINKVNKMFNNCLLKYNSNKNTYKNNK